MNILRLALLFLGATASLTRAETQNPDTEAITRLYQAEENGLRYYERENYKKAFDRLQHSATHGLKKSQYIVAFMFLKGQHVKQSVLLGMGWLGVASESGDPEWQSQYDGLYERATPGQRALIDRKVGQYIHQYGMATMNVSCARQAPAGSRRIETHCVKLEGPAYEIYPVEMPD